MKINKIAFACLLTATSTLTFAQAPGPVTIQTASTSEQQQFCHVANFTAPSNKHRITLGSYTIQKSTSLKPELIELAIKHIKTSQNIATVNSVKYGCYRKQVVAGINHAFVLELNKKFYNVRIYQNLNGTYKITATNSVS